MKRTTQWLLGAMLLFAIAGAAVSQESKMIPPPKVLLVEREFVKPGKGGAAHDKTESMFVDAFKQAKWATPYLATGSLSGKRRVLFLTPYDSFEAWEKDNAGIGKNATLSAALAHAATSDGELLSEIDESVLIYNEEQSLRASVDAEHLRYFEISLYRVRAGHSPEWNELVKMVKAAYEKVPGAHWVMFHAMYGQEDNTYVVFVPMKSLAEVDKSMLSDKAFADAMGEEGMKKLQQLEASAVEFYQTNVFQTNPKMSYAAEDWVKGDPEFWKPKPMAKAPAKAEKPAVKP